MDGGFKDWTNANVTTASEAREVVRSLKQQGADFIKIYDNLSRPAFFAIADESCKLGIPFAGHPPDTISDHDAAEAGQKSIEHLVCIPSSCSTDEAKQPQYEQALNEPDFSLANTIATRADIRAIDSFRATRCKELASVFRTHRTWQCLTLVVSRVGYAYDPSLEKDWHLKYIPKDWVSDWASFPERDLWFQDLTPADREGLARVYRRLVESASIFHREGVDFLAGTDVSRPYIFPGFSLHDELGLLVEAEFSPGEALKMATYNPAKFLGMLDRLGTVERGKLADLVLLDANPLEDIHNTQKIRAVIPNGRYLDRPALDKLLAEARANAMQ